MTARTETTRFAPSPSGHLHLGHAFSGLFSELAARQSGGRFLLRIEDIDTTRCRPLFTQEMIEDLTWLGLRWDAPPLAQSTRNEAYRQALDRLSGMGLLYPCFCTRADIKAEIESAAAAPHGPDGPLYPGLCRRLSPGEREDREAANIPYALRLDVQKARNLAGPLSWQDRGKGEMIAQPEIFGDVVLARKDIGTSYHLAVTLDDAFQKITLVTRGEDLFQATHVHRLLQALLELPVPQWHHHGLIEDEQGQRLAKRHGALALRQLRLQGKSAQEVRAMAGWED
ncbi:tRNA glutamyl-Q(34) synthetase GluQRS [Denitrobaculum tricleocarpae]|uniref:tRNA glutamyl-Q(34) synthetase GluQRS n=1 Tax=Denitrobaculum tricleocarpae TaxID=2591009 RepID=A0A545U1T1_9PROT|nr:tRNA glutamyl-Q(34) synthetase GluQRS [Denitrobaculum tricleocarpae]TQV83418.1 tRNA glutamyl-Q(34) synthetase GluQRS [Denitrobaculum tricleocarpae]